MGVACKRCGVVVRTYSSMRKWCVDCRKIVNLTQAKARKSPQIIVQSEPMQEIIAEHAEHHFEFG